MKYNNLLNTLVENLVGEEFAHIAINNIGCPKVRVCSDRSADEIADFSKTLRENGAYGCVTWHPLTSDKPIQKA